MTSLLPTSALRVAAAALARAGAGSALAAIVLLVLASSVRAEPPATASANWATAYVASPARAATAAVAQARQCAARTARLADVSVWCRSVIAPCLHVLRGSLPPARAP